MEGETSWKDSGQGSPRCDSLIGGAKIRWNRKRAVNLLIFKLGNDDYLRCICSGELVPELRGKKIFLRMYSVEREV